MGRRKNRKLERRQKQGGGYGQRDFVPRQVQPEDFIVSVETLDNPIFRAGRDEYDLLSAFGRGTTVKLKTCGGCKEFIEDGEGGRGTCLHPGSGILSPWTDTPGCPFHAASRRR